MKDTFDIEKLHPLTRLLLEKRGIVDVKAVEDFLFPSYDKHIGNPFDIYGMDKAVTRIIDAIKVGEKIAVYSDYDCDGIPGGVLLRTFFDDIGYPVEMYVPHRHNEGYGVHIHAIDILKEKGVTLIITVDSGITNIQEVAYAKTIGVDFIITDHHLPITQTSQTHTEGGDKKAKSYKLKAESSIIQVVPDAIAVLNSKQDVCNYSDDMLCGCAVAWKLSCALLSRLREESIKVKNSNEERITNFSPTPAGSGSLPLLPRSESTDSSSFVGEEREVFQSVLKTVEKLPIGYEKWLLDLVGISTISDMVPLQKENRALAHFGLKVLRLTKRHGLNQIFRMQGVSKEHLTEEDIAFTIAPRINAAGRMGDPIQAHHMLYEKDSVTAQGYAEDLEALNMERKESVKDITGNISFDHDVYKNNVIAVGDLSWGPGILGLVAQKIIDETGKPTFVWGRGGAESSELAEEPGSRSEERRRVPELASEGTQGEAEGKIIKGEIKGSCRSKGDAHVVELMARVQEMFPGVITHSGGHEQAGGFSCALDRVEELSNALNEAYKHVTLKELGNAELVADTDLSFEDVNILTHNAVDILSPFGVGNPKPLFSFANVTPLSVRWFGKKGEHLEIMYPKKKGEVKAIIFFGTKELAEKATKPHTLLAHLEKSVFRGKTELRLRIKDII